MSTTFSRVETFLAAILILISTGCGGGGGGSGSGSTALVAAPAFTTGALTSATAGSAYSYSVGVTGRPAPSLVASGLPAWLRLNGFVLSGTPSAGDVGATPPITLTAANGFGAPATQTFQITVAPAGSASAPAFTSTAPSSAAAGVAYTYTIAASGSPAPTISATTLPSWLTLAGNVLSGTPAAINAGANPVVLRATNASGAATQSFTIVVTSQTGVAPSFTTSPPTTGIVGAPFTYTVGTAGTPAPSLAGTTLPAWLTLGGAILSGTPPSAGTFSVVLTATNGVNPPATQSFSIVATAAQPSVTLATIDLASPSQPGNQTSTAATQLAANIGAPAPAISRGPGISPVSGGGSINSDGWTQGPVLGADDYYTVTVRPAPGFALSISSLALGGRRSSASGPATIDVRSSRDGFAASLVTFSASAGSSQTVNLPLTAAVLQNVAGPIELRLFGYGATSSGATFRVESFAVSGTLTAIAAGSFAPSFTSTPPTIAATGIAYAAPLGVTGNPAPTVVATGLPPGIALTGSAAAGYSLAGTPSGTGTFNVALTATNGVNPPAVLAFQIVVSAAAAPVFASAPVTSATALIAYDYFPFANGSPLPTIAVASTTAPWLTFSNGALGGIPPFPGVFGVTLTATSVAGTATQSYTITVAASTAPPTSNAFVQFEFATQTAPAVGNEPSWAAETVDPRLPAPVMTRAGITPSQASNAFGATGFPASATLSTAHYFTFTVTPTSGLTMSLDRLDFEEERSNSGPQSAAVRSSIDGFSANLITFSPAVVTFTRVPHTITLTAAPFQNLATPVEFRLYGFNAGVGTMRIDKVFLTGTLRPITGGVAPGFTSAAPTSATVGAAYTYAIAVTGNPPPAVTSSTLPSGLALSGNTVSGYTISGVPAVTGTSQITLTASNGVGSPALQTFPLTIDAAPSVPVAPQITSTPQTTATVGQGYSYTVVATGNPTPTVTATNLPAWLSRTGNLISGTPAAGDVGATGTITITASNGVGASATQPFQIAVTATASQQPGPSVALVTVTFTGQPGNQAQTPAIFVAPEITGPVALARGSGVAAATAGSSMSSNGWSTGAIDLNDYYGFTVTPAAGMQLTLTQLAFNHRISSLTTSPLQGSVRTSLDGFTADVGTFSTSTTAATPVAISLSAIAALQSVTSPVTLRIYGFGATTAAGTFRIEGALTLSGTATATTLASPPGDGSGSLAQGSTEGAKLGTAGSGRGVEVASAGEGTASRGITADSLGAKGATATRDARRKAAEERRASKAALVPGLAGMPPVTAKVGERYEHRIVASGTPAPSIEVTGLPSWLTRRGDVLEGIPAEADLGASGRIDVTARIAGVSEAAAQRFTVTVLPATGGASPLALAESLEGGILPRGWTQAGGDLDTPSLDLREIARPTLRFQHLHRGPGSLLARVLVSTDGGLTFREAAAWLLEGGLYGALVVDLAPALEGRATGNVVIRFESASVTDAAWVVEEVRVGEVWAVME